MTLKTKRKLKPCPFCNSTKLAIGAIAKQPVGKEKIYYEQYYVECENCGGRCNYAWRLSGAIDDWNYRKFLEGDIT